MGKMELRLPEISAGGEDVVITLWHAGEGDYVASGEDLVEVSTDKATFDIPAPCYGVLERMIKKPGEKAKTGEVIAEICTDDI